MRTTEYNWYQPDFAEYNIAQEAVIPFCDEDMNLVVCFGTAVGKTVIAECAFGFHITNGGKVAYVSPYRSLCSEKFDKWSKDFYLKSGSVAIQTGDRRSLDKKLHEASLTVMTSESFNGRTRSPQLWSSWLEELECLVIDEAHTIGDPNRGGAVEASLMRFTKLNPKCRIILLSATMDNAMEVAKWIKMLNKKQTKCFVSDWRPNKVEVIEFPVDGWNEMIAKTVERAGISNKKTIVFVHSKRIGKTLVKEMKKKGIRTAFHNASTGKSQRDKIEKAFDSPNSGFNVLVSTSTLGAGVNIG
jgi:replicative superfamily II helicase